MFTSSALANSSLRVLPETVETLRLIDAVEAVLPSGFLPGEATIEFVDLDGAGEFVSPCEKSSSPQIYGKLKKNRILLNQKFLTKLGTEETFDCGHRTWQRQATATIIHELAHLWEKGQRKAPSQTSEYTALVFGQKRPFVAAKLRNRSTLRLPDPYELADTREHFAVNFEYFLLDETFPCRRPNLSLFFGEIFGRKPTCNILRTIVVNGHRGPTNFSLSKGNVKEVHLLVAGKGQAAASRFGHVMFRLVTDSIEDDIVMGFVAQSDTIGYSNIKGLTGKYPSKLFVTPLSKSLEDYNKVQYRDLTSHKLELNDEERERVLDQLLTLFWEYSGSYYFINNNCADEALHVLQAALPKRILKQGVLTPGGLKNLLIKKKLISSRPVTTFPSHLEIQRKVFSLLTPLVGIEDPLAWTALTANERWEHLKKIETLSSQALYAALSMEQTALRVLNLHVQGLIGTELTELAEDDDRKTMAIELVQINNRLNYGGNLARGYGIPLLQDFEKENFNFAEERSKASEIEKKISAWAIGLPGVKEEIDEIQRNQRWILEQLSQRKKST